MTASFALYFDETAKRAAGLRIFGLGTKPFRPGTVRDVGRAHLDAHHPLLLKPQQATPIRRS
jgi:hypothetical protein